LIFQIISLTTQKHKLERTRAKLKKVQIEASSSTSQPSVFRSLTPEFDTMANKSLHEFSAPTTDNICTRPAADIEKSFELKQH
jgi:hypothetical protein